MFPKVIINRKHLKLILKPRLFVERITFRCVEYLMQLMKNINHRQKLKGTLAEDLDLAYTSSLELIKIVKLDSPKIIYDIGAHIGTWSLLAKAFIPDSIIHAFEPIESHITEFQNRISDIKDINLHQVALGNQTGNISINITNRSDASSLLEAAELVDEQYGVKKDREQMIKIFTLDDYIITQKIPLPDFIKLDVQGYELEVLKGAQQCINHAKWILCEVSFYPYYQNQPLFYDIFEHLKNYSYNIYAFGSETPTGSILTQIDVLFKRN